MNDHKAHWSKHRIWSREQKSRVEMAILAAVGRHHGMIASAPKRVTFRMFAAGEWDDDNLRAALKPARDALKSMGIINDDRPSAGHEFVYTQSPDRRRGAYRGVEITVEART